MAGTVQRPVESGVLPSAWSLTNVAAASELGQTDEHHTTVREFRRC
jgi:hypothetical protein